MLTYLYGILWLLRNGYVIATLNSSGKQLQCAKIFGDESMI
jgi:hypothetical protein